jgi:hypothetical protein
MNLDDEISDNKTFRKIFNTVKYELNEIEALIDLK